MYTPTAKSNPIPEATVRFVADDGRDVQAEMRPLAVHLLRTSPAAQRVLAAAAASKRTDAELMRVALGSRPDLGSDVAHAAGALYVARTGNLADWPAEDVERAATTLAEVSRA